MPPDSGSLAVIGGGVIGLSVARRAAQAGWSVRVHRSGAARRLLGGRRHAGPAQRRLARRGAAAAAGPGVAAAVAAGRVHSTGCPHEVVTARESLVVAVDRADVADLRTVADWLAAQGHPVTWTSAARDIEPLLAQGIRHGFRAPTELAVDNRALVDGAGGACERLGVEWDAPVCDLAAVRADTVVIANGIDAPALWPGLPIRPVKGEVLRLRWRQGVCRCRSG